MVALSFSVFLDDLLAGRKTHTIRRLNFTRIEQMARLGMQIYWHQRRPDCRFLFNSKFVKAQILDFTDEWWPCAMGYIMIFGYSIPIRLHVHQWPASITMTEEEADALARRDGFDSISSMQAQFQRMYGSKHEGLWTGIYFTPPNEVIN